MRSSLPEALSHIEKYEGGYVNHPSDPGGETNRGITARTARTFGYTGSMRELPREFALRVYRETYWKAVNGDGLPPGLDLTVFGMGVNAGPKRAVRLLQQVLGVGRDGRVGEITLDAAWDQMSIPLLERFRDRRLTYYRSLRIWRTFGRGWTNRTNGAHAAAVALWTAHQPVDDEPEPSSDRAMPVEKAIPEVTRDPSPFLEAFWQ